MQFLSISEDSPMPSRQGIAGESITPVYRLENGSFAEVFPASHIVKQDSERVPKTSAIYGLSVHEHCGSYAPQSQSLRTCQGSLLLMEDDSSTEFLATFPRAGMIVNGKLYRLSTSAHRTYGSESGLSAPWQTPVADDSVDRTEGKFNSRGEPKLSAQVLMWPTPRASDGEQGGPNQRDSQGNYALPGAVHHYHYPTPTANPELPNKNSNSKGPKNLLEIAKTGWRPGQIWPTPTTVTDSGGAALCKWGGSGSREKMKSMTTPEELNGSLNPEFVEYLMGYPIGWSSLKASVMPLSLKSPR
jgi:hypothetical protein